MSTWLGQGRPDSLQMLLLGVSMRVFLGEISMWIGRLSKEDLPHQSVWASANPLKDFVEQKGSWDIYLLLPSDIRLWMRTETTPPASLGLQHADSRAWDFLDTISRESVPQNTSLSFHTLLALCLWRTLTEHPGIVLSASHAYHLILTNLFPDEGTEAQRT